MYFLRTATNNVSAKEAIIGTVIMVVIATVFVLIRDKINKKKASTGEDREALWNILQKAVPDAQNYTKAYACWEWTVYQGKTRKTTYWYYGIAFNSEQIFIVPISCADGDISYSEAFCIRKSDLGMVNSKSDAAWAELYDKNFNEIISLSVFGENLKDDKYHPLNIIQEEEAKKFVAWKDNWMASVNAANGVEVTGKMKKPVKRRI